MSSLNFAGRIGLIGTLLLSLTAPAALAQADWETMKKNVPARGVCLLIDPPPQVAIGIAQAGEAMVKAQCADAKSAAAIRQAASAKSLLGTRLFVDSAPIGSLTLANDTADVILATDTNAPAEAELVRALRPGAKAIIGAKIITKPLPAGTDSWSHPYHGPDNNTSSTDQLARWPYLTQFLAEPLFSSQPEVTVAAGGRIFKAFGHMTFRVYQNASINQLFATSAYNGSMLWKKELKPGFMIHRNTIVATPEILYMGDNESCKLLDAATGEVKDQIVVPEGISDGPVWKWMAIQDGVLYALVGAKEVEAPVTKGTMERIGGWPWGMWPGYDYSDPKTAWGFGRTLIAIELKTKKFLWHQREQQYIDSRGTVMAAGRIFYYSPDKFLACLDTSTGKEAWRTSDASVLGAIGANGRAQHYITGFATSVYLRTNGKVLMFAGPQRASLSAINADDGKVLWSKPGGNFQIVLRDTALYALGEQGKKSYKLDLASGNTLAEFAGRRACTRATGTIDSVFCRAQEGTLRWDVSNDSLNHLAPMRPACHDGVIVSDGHLFWGPWICGCHLTLVGIIGLGPAGDFNFTQAADESKQLETFNTAEVKEFKVDPNDWPTYRQDNSRVGITPAKIPASVATLWEKKIDGAGTLTAPVMAGGLVFVGGTDGTVRAMDAATGAPKWIAYTGGSIFFPPTIAQGRAYVGSNDGHVYAFEAATGAPLWRFRVAPVRRDIAVYGEIMSTWPVAGGVVVSNGTLYAAAGISHFDGTHVVALDAITARLKWHNGTSGSLDPQVKNGISLCGALRFSQDPSVTPDGVLSFPGGNVYVDARFDARTGKCLVNPAGARTSQRIFLFPRKLWEPLIAADQQTSNGRVKAVSAKVGKGAGVNVTVSAPDSPRPLVVPLSEYAGSILGPDAALLLAHPTDEPWHLLAVKYSRETLWKTPLPAAPVHWGAAMDSAGRIAVVLEDGRLMCLRAK